MIPFSGYVIGGLGLAIVLVGGYAALEHSWRQNAEIVAAQEKEANKKNQETITNLNAANELAWKNTVDLQNKMFEIVQEKELEDAAVTELSGSDEEVRKFLSTPVPLKLRCLWGDAKCQNGTPSPNTQ